MGVASGCGEREAGEAVGVGGIYGMVSWRWVWVESMSVASGCGCKEVYRFPNITYPYILLLLCSFFATASLLLYS